MTRHVIRRKRKVQGERIRKCFTLATICHRHFSFKSLTAFVIHGNSCSCKMSRIRVINVFIKNCDRRQPVRVSSVKIILNIYGELFTENLMVFSMLLPDNLFINYLWLENKYLMLTSLINREMNNKSKIFKADGAFCPEYREYRESVSPLIHSRLK